MEIILVGKRSTRRTEYFLKAARQCGVSVGFVDWDEVEPERLAGHVVKLDPPSYQTTDLFEMNERIGEYQMMLANIQKAGCRFLNPPEVIGCVLNKRVCKEALIDHGVPVTQMIPDPIKDSGQLREAMERNRIFSVFVKPIFSSGAAGVMAYQINPKRAKEVAYVSCRLDQGELVNTKTLYRMEDSVEIRQVLDAVLSLGAVVERWHSKAMFQGKSYDLRVVWQFGHPAFAIARQSKGPVTNLHLNNAPLSMSQLHLSENTMAEIEEVCGKAMDVFPELSMAGIDVLLEKGTMQPRIIEINGQGDLMYQDIFQENRIYQEQIRFMAQMSEQG